MRLICPGILFNVLTLRQLCGLAASSSVNLLMLMRNRQWVICFILGPLGLLTCVSADAHTQGRIIQEESRTKSFSDVVFDLEFAITQRNFRITARNDIGRGIRERGFTHFPQAMVIHFCNLTYAREALELDPSFITHMPCRVAIYDYGDRVAVSTTSLPEDSDDARVNAFSHRINGMLHNILNFAVQ
jgi:uncharacterized protein (DUF302 family)